MLLKATWPFKSREHVLAHERAYLAGSYTPPGAHRIALVDKKDLEIERWLEGGGARRLLDNDRQAIHSVWLWKMRATIEATGGCPDPPASILSTPFASALGQTLTATSDSMMLKAIETLTSFKGVAVRAASAFIYWLRPDTYQVIDRRATQALNLVLNEADFTPENYLRYCELSRLLSKEHGISLRQADRALFTFQKLFEAHEPTTIST